MSTSPTSKKQRGIDKLNRIPVQANPHTLPKPDWLKIKLSTHNKANDLIKTLRKNQIVTVCEEASCPNLHECFSKGTASFMIMGDICTRRCRFCDVAHGRPNPLDTQEPKRLANIIETLKLNYVVITSVDRDDLHDGGASHFSACITQIRKKTPHVHIEILVPDFRGKGKLEKALQQLTQTPPNVFNHNIETVPSLYKSTRPGSSYQHSLQLLKAYKRQMPQVTTKSGLMLGLGEQTDEIISVLKDLKAHQVDMITLGQYLAPSRYQAPVHRYITPHEFDTLKHAALDMGFKHVASGPLVRSSYHADLQAQGQEVK